VEWEHAWWLAPKVVLVKDSGGDFSLCALREAALMPKGHENSYACFTRYPAWSLDLSKVEGDANTNLEAAFAYAKVQVAAVGAPIDWLEAPEPVAMADLAV